MTDVEKFIIGESPGASLKQLRQEQELSIQEVSTQLYLEPKIIEALEADNFEQLPAATYVRGYLRSYAKLLKVSADAILDMYQDDYAPEPPEIIPEVKLKTQQTSSRDKPMVAFSYLIVFVLILLLFAWWQSNFVLDTNEISKFFNSSDNNEQGSGYQLSYEVPIVKHPDSPFYRAPEIEETILSNSKGELTSQADSAQIKLTDSLQDTGQEITATTVNTDEGTSINKAIPLSANNTTDSSIDERGSGPDTVEIKLNANSWVEVFDHNDEKVYLNLARSGQTLLLHGTAPFNVLIGFSQGASVKFNGQDFDPAPFSRAGIARFSLGN